MHRNAVTGEPGDDNYFYDIGPFQTRGYRPDPDENGKVIDLQAEALEHDREYRELIYRQMQEAADLHGFHAIERIKYLAKRRRARAEHVTRHPFPCRLEGHDWDVEPVGMMFQDQPDIEQVATCRQCGVVRTYDHGTTTYTKGGEQS